MRKRLTCGLVVASLVCSSVEAQGNPPSVRFEWRAPPGCPTQAHVEREIERLLGRPLSGVQEPELFVRATVNVSESGFRLELTSTTEGLAGERALHAAGCTELGRAAALIVALSIDPKSVAEHTAAPEDRRVSDASASRTAAAGGGTRDPSQLAAEDHAEGEAEQSAAYGADAVETEEHSSNAEPSPELPEDQEEQEEGADDALAGTEPAEQRSLDDGTPNAVFSVGLGALLSTGVLPATSPGMGLWFGIDVGRFRLEASGSYLWPASAQHRGQPVAELQLLTAGLSGCYWLLSSRLQVGPCLGAEIGRIWGRGSTPEQSRGSTGFAAILGTVRAGYALLPELALVLQFGVMAPLRRTRFLIGDSEVHRADSVGTGGRAGLEGRF